MIQGTRVPDTWWYRHWNRCPLRRYRYKIQIHDTDTWYRYLIQIREIGDTFIPLLQNNKDTCKTPVQQNTDTLITTICQEKKTLDTVLDTEIRVITLCLPNVNRQPVQGTSLINKSSNVENNTTIWSRQQWSHPQRSSCPRSNAATQPWTKQNGSFCYIHWNMCQLSSARHHNQRPWPSHPSLIDPWIALTYP